VQSQHGNRLTAIEAWKFVTPTQLISVLNSYTETLASKIASVDVGALVKKSLVFAKGPITKLDFPEPIPMDSAGPVLTPGNPDETEPENIL
jgi:hypothetical protein